MVGHVVDQLGRKSTERVLLCVSGLGLAGERSPSVLSVFGEDEIADESTSGWDLLQGVDDRELPGTVRLGQEI